MKKYQILLVDDDNDNLVVTKALLEDEGYAVDIANSGEEAIFACRRSKAAYALILMDYLMPGMDGADTAESILNINPDQFIVMYSCDDSKEALKSSIRSGVIDFIEKDLETEQFLSLIRDFCAKYDCTTRPVSEVQSTQLIESVGMIGRSVELQRIAKAIKKYGPNDQTVMILGETGTGKEMVARALHSSSPRKNNPFVAVNCAAIPEQLLESTLFGHEKGAFTGAITSKIGKFMLAHRGTLFLDEIGDLPLQLQVKLLRVLQERQVEPVGSNRSDKIDVRIVTATHKNLKELLKTGAMREDLYYRLKVLTLELPPLRERPNDIEPLISHFSEMFSKTAESGARFERGTLDTLRRYNWPGNVRELKHVVESHLVRCSGQVIKEKDLDKQLFRSASVSLKLKTVSELEGEYKESLKNMIRFTLRSSKSKTEAASRMGISPSRLHYYIENLNISA